MEKLDLKWKNVPEGWALCFNNDCSLREQCLRWRVVELAPETLTLTRCVTPMALKNGQCPHFATVEKARIAYGFEDLYKNVLKKDFTPLRKQMTSMLQGKRYYYEYRNGKRPITPQVQQQIRELFEQFGYGDSVKFDEYDEVYEFPWL